MADASLSLDTLLTPRRQGDRFLLEVPDGWQQGRGAFGGVTLGAMARAATAIAPAGRPLRALDAQLLAPVLPGEIELRVTPLREGHAVSTLRVEARQGGEAGEVVGHAVAVCAAGRPTAPRGARLTPPAPPPWRDDPPLVMPAPPAPVFTRHLEYRSRSYPFAGLAGRPVEGWVRPRASAARRDAGFIAALADAWWPVAVVEMTAPRPIATVTFGLQLFVDEVAGDAPLYHRAVTAAAVDGYVTEFRELWTEDGELVSLNQQVIAILR
jgi:hypothetical protein